MSADQTSASLPWRPLTFGGVAAFAASSFAWTVAVAWAVATIAAASFVWFFHSAWEPSLRAAISRLPAHGAIRQGQLEWPEGSPVRLAEGTFLSIVVDPAGRGEMGLVADLQWEFCQRHIRLRSLLGYTAIRYPARWTMAFNRTELEPWWGAWRPAVLAGLGLTSVAGLLAVWALLATLYLWPARIVASLTDRPLSLTGAWRLAMASLLPGAILLSAAIVGYGLQRLNLVQLLFAGILHWVVGWTFVLISPLRLPRQRAVPTDGDSDNPFREPPGEMDT